MNVPAKNYPERPYILRPNLRLLLSRSFAHLTFNTADRPHPSSFAPTGGHRKAPLVSTAAAPAGTAGKTAFWFTGLLTEPQAVLSEHKMQADPLLQAQAGVHGHFRARWWLQSSQRRAHVARPAQLMGHGSGARQGPWGPWNKEPQTQSRLLLEKSWPDSTCSGEPVTVSGDSTRAF